jgi:hypothetical protein
VKPKTWFDKRSSDGNNWAVVKFKTQRFVNNIFAIQTVIEYKPVARINVPKYEGVTVVSEWIKKEEAKALCKLLNLNKDEGELP